MAVKVKPPLWFWLAAILLLLWGLVGVAGFQIDVALKPVDLAKMAPYDRHLYADRPGWMTVAYGVGVWTGLLGSVALLLRRGLARPLYIISLVGVIVLFGSTFVLTDIIAHKGLLVAAGFPVVIALLAIVEIWLAGLALRRGWIA